MRHCPANLMGNATLLGCPGRGCPQSSCRVGGPQIADCRLAWPSGANTVDRMANTPTAMLARQDDLVTRRQALDHMSEVEIDRRLGRSWQVILPGVYATFTGRLTARHRQRAALLLAGPESMLNDIDALRGHRVPYTPSDAFTRVLVRDSVQRASRDFVVIRRTTRLPRAVIIDGLPVVPAARAVAEFVLRHTDDRDGLAVAAAAVQRGKVAVWQLLEELQHAPARGRPRLRRVLEAVEAGILSAPEGDFRDLVLASKTLPEPNWNWLLQLPSGLRISPDALWLVAGLVHETNGRRFHAPDDAGEDVFEDMQRRHDALVTAGFTVLHNTPRRISADGRAVITEVESCFARDYGRGLPPGVVILRAGPPGSPSNVTSPVELAG
jgi:hypothetical protein